MPIVVAAIWAVILILAAAQRHQIINGLSDRIAHGKVKDAKAALRQLSCLARPPLDVFITAAVAPSRQVAQQAQTSITELMRGWRVELHAGRGADRVAAQLEQLAAGLNKHRDAFSSLDYPWLAHTTEQIVRLANSTPTEMTPELAMNCESLLALAAPRPRLATSKFGLGFGAEIQVASDDDFRPPSRLALQSIVPEDAADATAPEEVRDALSDSPAIPTNSLLHWSRPNSVDATQLPSPRTFEWHENSGRAIVLTPIANTRQDLASTLANHWQDVDTRLLLENWLLAKRNHRTDYASELRRRGFGALREDVVRLALSDDTAGRVQLVHDLMDTPGVGVRAWLLFMAEDSDAEVRLSALTLMATSRDPQLLDSAWQLAVHDQDPRIARLANRIRDLRDSTRRH